MTTVSCQGHILTNTYLTLFLDLARLEMRSVLVYHEVIQCLMSPHSKLRVIQHQANMLAL